MRSSVRKWGNSLGVRIPRGLADDLRLSDGDEVELTLKGGQLVLAPVLSLRQLVADITPHNLPELVDDVPRGGESW